MTVSLPGNFSHLNMLNLVTAAKSFFSPCKMAFMSSEDWAGHGPLGGELFYLPDQLWHLQF